jgi:hypothetical protein
VIVEISIGRIKYILCVTIRIKETVITGKPDGSEVTIKKGLRKETKPIIEMLPQ